MKKHLMMLICAGLPVAPAWALESVAQNDVGGGSAMAAGNLALQGQITNLQGNVTAINGVVQGLQQQVSWTLSIIRQLTENGTDGSQGGSDGDGGLVSNTTLNVVRDLEWVYGPFGSYGAPSSISCPAGKVVLSGTCNRTCTTIYAGNSVADGSGSPANLPVGNSGGWPVTSSGALPTKWSCTQCSDGYYPASAALCGRVR